jgi:hypothetical protein
MLASLKLAADFSRGCASRRIGHARFATPTTPAFANGTVPALRYPNGVPASHGSESILSAPTSSDQTQRAVACHTLTAVR